MKKILPGHTYWTLTALIEANVLPAYIKTSKAVKLINDKRFHRAKLYSDEYKELLGAKRVGSGRNYEFDLLKVLQLKYQLENYLE